MRVLVVGGGVAGSAVAIALREVADVTVVEARPDPAGDVGSFVSLAVNGLRGLDALGCLDDVRSRGFAVDRQLMWSASGKLLADVPRGRREEDTLRGVTIMRGQLVDALRDAATRAGAALVTGERLVDLESVDADLVVGADGLWSTTRRLLDPTAPQPRYAGLYTVCGVAEGVDVPPGTFNMTFASAGAFLHVAAPNGETWWAAQVADPVEPDRTADTDWLARVAGLYRGEATPFRIIAATTRLHPTTVMHTLAPVPTRHTDRAVLIGDAAHPVGAGQGASMAVEDALALARHLKSAPIPTALAAYDAERLPRITRLLKAADDNRDRKTSGPVKRWAQTTAMKLFFRHFYPRATAWLYAYDPGDHPPVAALLRTERH
ncbi:FAD-dependent oxidoreductase [Saccharothrix variisporea]|uniref:2-polyprenyl-6-methoxyphenol hydroxylase-like FAD-dependent oxidoreductase n=1 Tax=Saccharothrix variisporea TaxID=543527 RepID=A0A495X396_9PSEU|nr:NAD(P)/FAD-dependent oxidoreductase [Saccharothrix variisporea]RKT67644.1 2-polyprenyl-6-methoxyphenol hydroxylase-like FAD-dependent oxidoreductase [Saccharothrix variisporea]